MNLQECEIQVLASLYGAQRDKQPTDRAALEARGQGYWIYREDWSTAFDTLLGKALIAGGEQRYELTERGNPIAETYLKQRPDHFTGTSIRGCLAIMISAANAPGRTLFPIVFVK